MWFQVVRCCLEHAASVAKTFLMSDCVVVEIKEPEPVAAGNPMDNSGYGYWWKVAVKREKEKKRVIMKRKPFNEGGERKTRNRNWWVWWMVEVKKAIFHLYFCRFSHFFVLERETLDENVKAFKEHENDWEHSIFFSNGILMIVSIFFS